MQVRLESFGVPYTIEIEDARLVSRAALRAVLPPFTRVRRDAAVGRRYRFVRVDRRRTLVVDGEEPIACPTIRAAQDALEGELALHVAAEAPERIFIHSGVVGWQGRALLLPGRTMTGKSTLVSALVHAGATYHSDEYAVLDADGLVHPYPRRMSLRQTHGLPRRVLPSRIGRAALPVGWILGTRFEADHAGLDVTTLSPGRTALLLVDNAVAARLSSARVMNVARKVSEVAEGAFLVRGEARRAVKELLPLLAGRGMLKASSAW